MTEQPVETEQQFLGNDATPVASVTTVVELPVTPLQHYSPGAHLRRPSWSPVDDVELASLARKSAHANRKLAIAKAESVKAEESLQLALGVEHFAEEEVNAANEALVAFTRKGTGL